MLCWIPKGAREKGLQESCKLEGGEESIPKGRAGLLSNRVGVSSHNTVNSDLLHIPKYPSWQQRDKRRQLRGCRSGQVPRLTGLCLNLWQHELGVMAGNCQASLNDRGEDTTASSSLLPDAPERRLGNSLRLSILFYWTSRLDVVTCCTGSLGYSGYLDCDNKGH